MEDIQIQTESQSNASSSGVKTDHEDPYGATSIAIWTENVILLPGNVKYPIRVVIVDNNFKTRFDRLVKLPPNHTTHIYRVLDHGIPWQHLKSNIGLEDVKQSLLSIAKGKRLVVYDAWETIGLFDFTEQQISRFKICDLKFSMIGENEPIPFWDLVKVKLGYTYSGKPGNYDALEITDFIMSIFIQQSNSISLEPVNASNDKENVPPNES